MEITTTTTIDTYILYPTLYKIILKQLVKNYIFLKNIY